METKGARGINDIESELINDLYNLGQTKAQLAKLYDVTIFTITNHISKQRKLHDKIDYSVKDMSDVMVKFTLMSLARNVHKLNIEQQLRFLPDLLRVQAEREGESDNAKTHLYLPKKVENQYGGFSSNADDGEPGSDGESAAG